MPSRLTACCSDVTDTRAANATELATRRMFDASVWSRWITVDSLAASVLSCCTSDSTSAATPGNIGSSSRRSAICLLNSSDRCSVEVAGMAAAPVIGIRAARE